MRFIMIHQGKIVMEEETDRILGNYGVLKLDDRSFASLDKKIPSQD